MPASGPRVDGMRVPLWTRVKNGQSLKSLPPKVKPRRSTWLEIATTGKAKTAIRRSLREADRERFRQTGRELARSHLSNVQKSATDKALRHRGAKAASGRADDLCPLGQCELTGREVVQAVYPDLAPKPGAAKLTRARAVIGLRPGQSLNGPLL